MENMVMAKKASKWDIDSCRAEFDDYTSMQSITDDIVDLHALCNAEVPINVYLIKTSSSLRRIGYWHELHAAIRILDGDASGWEEMISGWRCHVWGIPSIVQLHDHATGGNPLFSRNRMIGIADFSWNDLNAAATAILKGMVFEETRFTDWLGNRLIRAVTVDERLVPREEWLRTPFELAAVKLFALSKGLTIVLTSQQAAVLGPYTQLFDAWEGDITQVMLSLCDYHCENSHRYKKATESLFIPFGSAPDNLFPFEIEAIMKIRRRLGLSMPHIDHPLMSTKLAELASVPIPEPDELLDEATATTMARVPFYVPLLGHDA